MQLSIIIVNYNVKYFLEQALLSVRRAASGLDVEVIVVDNNSVDDSAAMVREKFPEVKLIENQQNTGFAVANNQAIAVSKGKYVLLLNPDTVVEESTFVKCLQFMDGHREAGALGVRMIDGSGKFLPESKRGFPTAFVAFCKTFGLSTLFPKSRIFNSYHLGYLDECQVHEVDVLSGAFMFLRKETLDKVGLLDETFFMYGEDIDLSYRIKKGGYKNYYFPDTTIIHYKGESTKKGSLNYVRTFYQAMIIFAQKHFEGTDGKFFVLLLKMAIYLRAFMTLIYNWWKNWSGPILDAAMIFAGLYFLKDFWAVRNFNNIHYYPDTLLKVNIPLYIGIWLSGIYFYGGYDRGHKIKSAIQGLVVASILLMAIYGLLPSEYRSSRMLLLLGAVWALISTVAIRIVGHFIRYRNFELDKSSAKNYIIIGSEKESYRVRQLMFEAQVQQNFIGTVSPSEQHDPGVFLNDLSRLDEVIQIYKVNEIIFCSRDISSQEIMRQMSRLGSEIDYKIVPEESLSIIGSNSKNNSGELYTIDIQFNIATPIQKRNKRALDVLLSLLMLPLLPLLVLVSKRKFALIVAVFSVISGSQSWVAYAESNGKLRDLPKLKKGILKTTDGLNFQNLSETTIN
ncbi:MAG: glycosyltransferase family 2 protein, partial [Saprospiraceae bacterium]